MKKSLILTMGLATIVLGGAAMAATAPVAVTANVVGTCKFSIASGAVAFGNLDPSLATTVNGTVSQPEFWCTKGATYTIADDLGLHELPSFRMVSAVTPAEFIPYTFTYLKTGLGSGPQNKLTMNIAATVLGTDYANAPAGAYTDTVTLTITP